MSYTSGSIQLPLLRIFLEIFPVYKGTPRGITIYPQKGVPHGLRDMGRYGKCILNFCLTTPLTRRAAKTSEQRATTSGVLSHLPRFAARKPPRRLIRRGGANPIHTARRGNTKCSLSELFPPAPASESDMGGTWTSGSGHTESVESSLWCFNGSAEKVVGV